MVNSFTNIVTGNPVQPTFNSYQSLSLTGNVQLIWSTQFEDTGDNVGQITDISVNNNGYLVFLPDATQASVGQSITFSNVSSTTKTFTVVDFAAGNLVTLSTGQSVILYLINNSTQAGSWRMIPFGGGFLGVSSVAATNGTPGISITGSPITTAGTLTFSLSNSLVSLTNLATTGIVVQSVAGTYVTRTLVGGANIDITDADGVLGNPIIDLSDTISGISSLDVGNFNIATNAITGTTVNQDLHIIPNGTGSLLIGPGLTPPAFSSTGDLSNVDTLAVITGATIGDVAIASDVITSTTGPLVIASSGTDSLKLKGASNTNVLTIDQNNNLFHPAIPKCVAQFAGASGTISQSYNVTSVTRTGAGQYNVVVPGALFGTVLIPVASCTGGAPLFVNINVTSLTTFTISVANSSNTLTDPTTVYFIVGGY